MYYNRDIEIDPVLDALFTSIYGQNPYKSPTDMGVNMVGFCISDDEAVREASKQEIIRRYFQALCHLANGKCNDAEVKKLALLQQQVGINTAYRRTTVAARERRALTGALNDGAFAHAAAIELPSHASPGSWSLWSLVADEYCIFWFFCWEVAAEVCIDSIFRMDTS